MTDLSSKTGKQQEYRHIVEVIVDKDSQEYLSCNSNYYSAAWRRWVEVAWGLIGMIEATVASTLVKSEYGSIVWRFAQLLEEERILVSDDDWPSPPLLKDGKLRLPRIRDAAWNDARYLWKRGQIPDRISFPPNIDSLILAMSVYPPPPSSMWHEHIAGAIYDDPSETEEYWAVLLGGRTLSSFSSDYWWEVVCSFLGWQRMVGTAMFNFPVTEGKVIVDSTKEEYYAILCDAGDDSLPINVWVIVPKSFPRSHTRPSLSSIRGLLFYNENVRKIVRQSGNNVGQLIVL